MSLTCVQNFSISLDGFGTGEGQSHDAHFGHAGDRLHEWLFTTRWSATQAVIGRFGLAFFVRRAGLAPDRHRDGD